MTNKIPLLGLPLTTRRGDGLHCSRNLCQMGVLCTGLIGVNTGELDRHSIGFAINIREQAFMLMENTNYAMGAWHIGIWKKMEQMFDLS